MQWADIRSVFGIQKQESANSIKFNTMPLRNQGPH